MGNATLGSVVGFERLRLDIERAGFLSSPNIQRDPKRCPTTGVNATWPALLSSLAAVFIQPTNTSTLPVQQANHITPDQIILAGSYASTEQFPTRSIQDTGGSHVIILETQNGPMTRLGYQNLTSAADQRAFLLSIFGQGRALRIVDQKNYQQYGTIADVQTGPNPAVVVSNGPNILYNGAAGNTDACGIVGNGQFHLVNVVNFIKYSIRGDMATFSRYAPLYASGTTVAGAVPATDAGRTELVREELTTAGVTITGSEEIIAEFAVDLSFGVTVAQTATVSGSPTEQLVTLAPGDATVAWAGNAATMPVTRGPQRIRAIRARLSVRSREADRLAGMPDGGGVIGPGLFRIGLGGNGKGPFARVRTVQADIALRNQRDIKWL